MSQEQALVVSPSRATSHDSPITVTSSLTADVSTLAPRTYGCLCRSLLHSNNKTSLQKAQAFHRPTKTMRFLVETLREKKNNYHQVSEHKSRYSRYF